MRKLTLWGRSRQCGRPWRCARRCSCRRGRDRSVGRMGRKWTSLDRSQWRWPPDDQVIQQQAWTVRKCTSCGSWQLHWYQEPVRTMINVPRLGTEEMFKLIWNDFLILKWMERRFLWTILISFLEKKLTSHRAVYLSAVTILYDQTSLICISICSQNLIKWKVAPRFVFGDLHHHNISFSTV